MSATTFDLLLSEIESKDFFTNFLLINTTDMLIDFIESNEQVRKLRELVLVSSYYIDILVERIKKLWRTKKNIDTLHPYDHSMAVYIYVIYKTHIEKVVPVLEFIFKHQRKNIWWTYIIYNYIIKNLPQETYSFRIRKINKYPESSIKSLTKRIKTASSDTKTDIF